jgi:hypothetical protein
MLGSFETQYKDVKLFPLENSSIQYNPELTSVCVLPVLFLFNPSKGE